MLRLLLRWQRSLRIAGLIRLWCVRTTRIGPTDNWCTADAARWRTDTSTDRTAGRTIRTVRRSGRLAVRYIAHGRRSLRRRTASDGWASRWSGTRRTAADDSGLRGIGSGRWLLLLLRRRTAGRTVRVARRRLLLLLWWRWRLSGTNARLCALRWVALRGLLLLLGMRSAGICIGDGRLLLLLRWTGRRGGR